MKALITAIFFAITLAFPFFNSTAFACDEETENAEIVYRPSYS